MNNHESSHDETVDKTAPTTAEETVIDGTIQKDSKTVIIEEPRINWKKHIISFFFTALLVFMIFLATVATVIPGVLKGASLTIYTQSMEPYLYPGDMAVVIPTDGKDINIGDVISYHPLPSDPTLITHRVIGKSANARDEYTFNLQGDNNPTPDTQIVTMKMVAGKVMYKIPKLGLFAQGVGDSGTRSMVVYVVAGILYLYVVVSIIKGVISGFKEKKKKKLAKKSATGEENENVSEISEENDDTTQNNSDDSPESSSMNA